MTWIEYYTEAAVKSKGNTELWIRYLSKAIERNKIWLTQADVEALSHSLILSSFQRVFLKLAAIPGTSPWEIVVETREPYQSTSLRLREN